MQEPARIRPGSVRPKAFNDGLISLVSGMGTTTDPRSYQRYHKRWMSDFEIEQAYRGSWLMRRVVDQPATECVREWRDWQAEKDDIGALEKEEKRIDVRGHVRMGLSLGGLGGGATIVYMDGDQSTPADPAKVGMGAIRRLQTWHRSRFSLGPMITDWADDWFGYPQYYEVQLTGGTSSSIKFHPSRVIEWKGKPAPYIAAADWQRSFWGDSDVEIVIDAVQNVDASQNGFAALIKDARNRRIYIPKLLEMLATAGGEAMLAKRLQAFALGESSNSVSWLDGGDGDGKGAEKIEDRQMNWAGMKDILTAYLDAAAAAADRPATVLLGKSPDGMNASGTSDLAIWEKTIKGKQDLDVRPRVDRLDAFLIPSALGRQDDSIWYSWAPLSTQSEKDEATTFWNTMQGLEILAGLNLIPEIALSKATQTLLSERGWIPGLDDALAEIPETERFPELEQPGAAPEPDPNALVASGGQQQPKGGDQSLSAGGGAPALRRAANDALKAKGFDDAVIAQVLDAAFGGGDG
ncbi:DUF1073 domain-containing protein [Companilactobacillus sp.]|uniref:phage portal protein n=1 Tax=Companilactobacillus sp. TaxID=2767905 RepID=UPI002626DDE4|nr:DUF1073 domain-containing protein [Companilactobacillus sp.]